MLHPFHAFPVHLYHESKPPVVANDAGTEAEARAAGYGDEYIPQKYPRMVHGEVKDMKEQREAAKAGFNYGGPVDAPFPHTVSRTFKSAEEEESAKTNILAPSAGPDLQGKPEGDTGSGD